MRGTCHRARVVAAHIGEALRLLSHEHSRDLGRGTLLAEQPGHDPHRPIDVAEERLVTGTEVIEAIFTVGRLGEAVLGAAPVAHRPDFTVPAITG